MESRDEREALAEAMGAVIMDGAPFAGRVLDVLKSNGFTVAESVSVSVEGDGAEHAAIDAARMGASFGPAEPGEPGPREALAFALESGGDWIGGHGKALDDLIVDLAECGYRLSPLSVEGDGAAPEMGESMRGVIVWCDDVEPCIDLRETFAALVAKGWTPPAASAVEQGKDGAQ